MIGVFLMHDGGGVGESRACEQRCLSLESLGTPRGPRLPGPCGCPSPPGANLRDSRPERGPEGGGVCKPPRPRPSPRPRRVPQATTPLSPSPLSSLRVLRTAGRPAPKQRRPPGLQAGRGGRTWEQGRGGGRGGARRRAGPGSRAAAGSARCGAARRPLLSRCSARSREQPPAASLCARSPAATAGKCGARRRSAGPGRLRWGGGTAWPVRAGVRGGGGPARPGEVGPWRRGEAGAGGPGGGAGVAGPGQAEEEGAPPHLPARPALPEQAGGGPRRAGQQTLDEE